MWVLVSQDPGVHLNSNSTSLFGPPLMGSLDQPLSSDLIVPQFSSKGHHPVEKEGVHKALGDQDGQFAE